MAVRTSLRCVVPQIQSAVGIYFRRGKAEVSRLFRRWNFGFIHLSTRQRLEGNEPLTTGCRLLRHPETTPYILKQNMRRCLI